MAQIIPKILVIEDTEALRFSLVEILTFEGYSVVAAENGREGLQQAYQFRPNLIICDVMMPEMDGYEVLKHVRETLGMPFVRFIFLTAKTMREDMRFGMESGADDYLTKPFVAKDLLKCIQLQLAKQQAQQAEAEKKVDDLRGELITALPHELRTPLTTLVGFIDLLVDDIEGFSSEQIREIMLMMRDASGRMWRLIENYILYCQIVLVMNDAPRRKTILAQIDKFPIETITAAAAAVSDKYQRKDDLHLTLCEELPVVISDDNLQKLVYELLDNAFKFSTKGQPVTINMHYDHAQFVIEIMDYGRGMNPDEIEQIGAYKQFNRARYEQQGSGLGLTIARLLAELHGGNLVVESRPDGPTQIIVILSLAPEQMPA